MDYNPYNRNALSQNDLNQRKLYKLNETNNWILGNSFIQNNNNTSLIILTSKIIILYQKIGKIIIY